MDSNPKSINMESFVLGKNISLESLLSDATVRAQTRNCEGPSSNNGSDIPFPERTRRLLQGGNLLLILHVRNEIVVRQAWQLPRSSA